MKSENNILLLCIKLWLIACFPIPSLILKPFNSLVMINIYEELHALLKVFDLITQLLINLPLSVCTFFHISVIILINLFDRLSSIVSHQRWSCFGMINLIMIVWVGTLICCCMMSKSVAEISGSRLIPNPISYALTPFLWMKIVLVQWAHKHVPLSQKHPPIIRIRIMRIIQ